MSTPAREHATRTNLLTVRIGDGIISRTKMERAAQKLIKEREQLHRQIETLKQRVKTVETALEIIDLRLGSDPKFVEMEKTLDNGTFADQSLPDACNVIFAMYEGWLDKNQMEYLLTLGGYQFEAKDPTNSVDVTLRRMATAGECEADKTIFRNRYRGLKTEAKQ
jgi:hypothetical protein